MLQFFAGNYKSALEQLPAVTMLYVSKIDSSDLAEHPRTAHAHNGWFEMVLVRRGGGRVVIGEHAYNVKEGDLLLYNKGVVHDEMPETNRELDILCLAFTGFTLAGLESDCLISPGAVPVITLGESYQPILQIWLLIFNTLKENGAYADVTCHFLTQSLITRILPKIEEDALEVDIDKTNLRELSGQIKKFIDEHYAEQLSLQTIGASLNLSPFYMAHVFKKITGFAPMQYISKRRLGEAQEMLIHTDRPITDIALDVGYNNISSFNYAFAKFIGMSPSRFRKTYTN